ncbi:methionyl-tRNA formyltransferase, partial [Myxococcota bacterium]|nr:methionyl-tRNA formyltransferase [Myxococcota bacterium]
MRLVFFGSPEFAEPALRVLHEHHEVVLVVTQPDRPKGRGQKLAPTRIKEVALELGLPCVSPKKIKSGSLWDNLRDARADYFIVTAYGRILPRGILDMPRLGSLNIHPSRLPLHRGPAPVNWALLCGDESTAVTVMEISEEMDAGDIIRVQEVPILPTESGGALLDRCAVIGAALLNEV